LFFLGGLCWWRAQEEPLGAVAGMQFNCLRTLWQVGSTLSLQLGKSDVRPTAARYCQPLTMSEITVPNIISSRNLCIM
jgi:hypothetical protein